MAIFWHRWLQVGLAGLVLAEFYLGSIGNTLFAFLMARR